MILKQIQKVIEEEIKPRLNFEGEELHFYEYCEGTKTLFVSFQSSCNRDCVGCMVQWNIYFIEYFFKNYFKEEIKVQRSPLDQCRGVG